MSGAPGERPEPRLAEQTEALGLYLEALFTERPAALPVPVAPAPPRPVIDLPAAALRVVTDAVPAAPLDAPPVPLAATAPAPAPPRAGPASATRPAWARAPFPCLLLTVRGLSLALPLVKLNRILDWVEPTPIPGYQPWLLGMLRTDTVEHNLKVVDTARFVMPERLAAAGPDTAGGNPYRHIVMIGDGEWALTCETVSEVLTIDPDKVRWRTGQGKRPWLAGTVVDQLCALLDVEQLARLLSDGTAGLDT